MIEACQILKHSYREGGIDLMVHHLENPLNLATDGSELIHPPPTPILTQPDSQLSSIQRAALDAAAGVLQDSGEIEENE